MEIAKYIFIIVASVTLFGIIGGMDPANSVVMIGAKAMLTGAIVGTFLMLKEYKGVILSKIVS
ncbi:MAG TPA: hypothetical protein DEQ34_12780 [Balneolaceae bacterium]|nr:hypothetical protein [Balneolaceae bacterium]|tara:strand:+ start:155 stop:343 length:189 start_codon:yes stop_codon:yes gene_type:complete